MWYNLLPKSKRDPQVLGTRVVTVSAMDQRGRGLCLLFGGLGDSQAVSVPEGSSCKFCFKDCLVLTFKLTEQGTLSTRQTHFVARKVLGPCAPKGVLMACASSYFGGAETKFPALPRPTG